jgi:hypothetical protein
VQGVLLLDRVTVRDADFRHAAFDRFSPNGCVFERCDFRSEAFGEQWQALFTSRRQSVFRECHFDGADLTGVRPGQARFERCTFADANLDGWLSACAEFIECRFSGRIRGVIFHGRPWGAAAQRLDPLRSVNAFSGNDFSAADLRNTVFVNGIDVRSQIWPEGGDYLIVDRIHQRFTKARQRVLDWPDHEARNEGLSMLQDIAFLYGQQREIVARRVDERWSAQPDVQRRVWETIERVF